MDTEEAERLKPWATPRQEEIIDALLTHGTMRGAAAALNIHFGTVQSLMARLRLRVQKHSVAPMGREGYAPNGVATQYDDEGNVKSTWLREIPEPDSYGGEPEGDARDGGGAYVIKGVSTLYGQDGGVRAQWVKTRLDEQKRQEEIKAGIAAFLETVQPIPAPEPPKHVESDIIPWIQIGDAHLGMLAHEAETGKNFDLKIAERELCVGINMIVEASGDHERCVINDLGDFTHYENFAGTTEASGHALDYDGRFPKMITVYSRIMRHIVSRVLEKYRYVDVIINQANHSRTNDIWMAELLRAVYGHTGRVHVLDNSSPFIAYRMGNTLVMTHHGDKCKHDHLLQVMSVDFQADWGETDYHYVDIGHIHHGSAMKERPGAVIESWNTLAPSDKYSHDAGYRSRQAITIVDRSRTYGEVGRRTLPIKRIRDRIQSALSQGETVYTPRPKRVYSV